MPSTLAHQVADDVDVQRLRTESDDRHERVAQDVKIVGKVLLDGQFQFACRAYDLFAGAGVTAVCRSRMVSFVS